VHQKNSQLLCFCGVHFNLRHWFALRAECHFFHKEARKLRERKSGDLIRRAVSQLTVVKRLFFATSVRRQYRTKAKTPWLLAVGRIFTNEVQASSVSYQGVVRDDK
jgi:hypothetical protein